MPAINNNDMMNAVVRPLPFEIWDYLALLFFVIAACSLTYHPYFFGDEATVFREVGEHSSFFHAVLALSQYKPRLVFNSIWAAGVVFELPRYFFAIITAASLFLASAGVAAIAVKWLHATKTQLWLIMFLVLGSRFGAMLYYDYVAGIIESLSLALFAWSFFFADAVVRARRWPLAPFSIGLATLAVLVHERYMAGVFAVALSTLAVSIFYDRKRGAALRRDIVFCLSYCIVPILAFVLLNVAIGGRSLTTGTAGAEVALGVGTLEAFVTYLANVFLGTSFGHPWFVGDMAVGLPWRLGISMGCAAVFILLWTCWAKTLDKTMLGRGSQIFAVILGMTAVASLPGLERQEARWMLPVSCLVALLALASRVCLIRLLLISSMAVLSLVGWARGSYGYIYNVYESKTARALGEGLNGLVPPGNRAILIGAEDSTWGLGLRDGVDVFSRVNSASKMHIDVFDPSKKLDLCRYDFGIVKYGADETGSGKFALLDLPSVARLLGQNRDSAAAPSEPVGCGAENIEYGSVALWDHWSWKGPVERSGDAIVLRSIEVSSGFRQVPASELDRKVLTYEVRTVNPGLPSTFRLQVNWIDTDGRFISTTIKIVKVGGGLAPYSVYLVAPKDAVSGLIYANLHDGETNPVMLRRVSIGG